jgi:TonB family protein
MQDIYTFLVTHALMSCGVLVLAAAACSLLSRGSAAHRHFIWSLAFSSLLIVPLAGTLIAPLLPTGAEPQAIPAVIVTHTPVVAAAPTAKIVANTVLPWRETLAMIWLSGTALLLLRTAGGLITCHRRRRRSTRLENAGRIAAELSAELGLSSRPQVCESAEISVPETFGLIRPAVLLPPAARDWDSDRLRLVLLHEFVHIQRSDWAAQMVARISSSLFWFNPLCWYALRRLCDEREVACDDGVLRRGIVQADYAQQLIEIARSARLESPALSFAMVRPSNLEGRIRAILSPQRNRRSLTLRHRIFTLVPAILVIAAASLVTSPAQTGSASISGTVRDASRAVVPQAEVILSGGKGQEIVRTSAVGTFDFSGFPDGTYTLKVMHPGFRVFEKKLEITAASPIQLDVTLDIGRISERIEVTAQGQSRPQVARPSTVLQPAATERTASPVQVARAEPQQPLASSGPRRTRVGGSVQPPRLIESARPVYPQHLIPQGVEGTVVMQAVIGTDGQILNVEPSNSQVDPDLIKASMDAVKQWRYAPSLLNGQPVEVLTTITIDFRLKP